VNEFLANVPSATRMTRMPQAPQEKSKPPGSPATTDVPFAAVLDQMRTSKRFVDQSSKEHGVRVSGHAELRLKEGNVHLSSTQWRAIGGALDAAANKGAKDAFLVLGQVGLVVHVPSRTVVTAFSDSGGKVVTNVDSVVVIPQLDR
jgi:flagellar operon protein